MSNDTVRVKELEREVSALKLLLSEEQLRFKSRVELFDAGIWDAKHRIAQLEKEIKDIEDTDQGITFRLAQASLWSLRDLQKIGHSDQTCMYYYDFVRQNSKGPRSCTCALPMLIKLTQEFGDRHNLPPLPTAEELAKRLEKERPKYDKLAEGMKRQTKVGPELKDQMIGWPHHHRCFLCSERMDISWVRYMKQPDGMQMKINVCTTCSQKPELT